MGFSDVDAVPVAQTLELGAAQLAGEPVPLKLVKFSNVTVLSVFVESNQGGCDTTVVSKVALAGSAGDTFNVAEIKKVEEGK